MSEKPLIFARAKRVEEAMAKLDELRDIIRDLEMDLVHSKDVKIDACRSDDWEYKISPYVQNMCGWILGILLDERGRLNGIMSERERKMMEKYRHI